MKIKAKLFLMAFLSFLQPAKARFAEKPVFISLGNRCIPAGFLRYYNLRSAAYPFDWVYTSTFEMVYKIIQEDFKNFLLNDNLVVNSNHPSWIYDQLTGVYFGHDFSWDKSKPYDLSTILESYEKVKAKYDRRIQRFRDTLASKRSIIFLRIDIKDAIDANQEEATWGTKEQAIRLCALIHEKYPELVFHYIQLGIAETHKQPWNIPGISNFFIDGVLAGQWNYGHEFWRGIVREIERITGWPIDDLKEPGSLSHMYG